MTDLGDFTLVAADGTTELGVIHTYESAQIIARYNAVSTWELTLPYKTDATRYLLDAFRPRVIVRAGDGSVFRSGPVTRIERELSVDGDTVVFSGVDDLVWLRRRLAHPQPTKATPPYNGQAYDVRQGSASVVMAGFVDANAGPGAVPGRRVSGLTVPIPGPMGPNVKVSARYQNLLELVTRTAERAKLGIEVKDLVFTVTQPAGPSVIFSQEVGTLAGWTSAQEAPETNFVYVAGGGVGTSRVIREYQDVDSTETWGRIEGFDDRRDTVDTAELDEAGAEVLAEIPPPELELATLDIKSQRFLVDWQLGDTATVTMEGETFVEVIREVNISLEGNAPPMIVPVIGGRP